MRDHVAELFFSLLLVCMIFFISLNAYQINKHNHPIQETIIASEAPVIEPEEIVQSEPIKCWQSIYFMSIPVSVAAFNTCTGEVKEYPLLVIQEVMENNIRRADERIEKARKSLSM